MLPDLIAFGHKMFDHDEIFDVVDVNNIVISQASRSEVHKKGLMHRSVHILVFNFHGDLFLQKRSMVKDENPGLWDTAAAGHVGAGENYLHSAQRELKEELGLNVSIKEVMRIPAQLNTLWEHVRVYECITNHQIKINGLEISEGRYWTLPELTQSIESNPKIFTSTFHLIFNAYINIDK